MKFESKVTKNGNSLAVPFIFILCVSSTIIGGIA